MNTISNEEFAQIDEYSNANREKMQKPYLMVAQQLNVTFTWAKRRHNQKVKSMKFKLHNFARFDCPKRGCKFQLLTSDHQRNQ